MTTREQKSATRRSNALFVDRLLYERRPGGGRFVTFTRRAQLALFAVFLICLGLAVVSTAGLVLGYRFYREQVAMASGHDRVADPAGDGEALAEMRRENERLRAALEAARSERRTEAGTLDEARSALEVEKRAIAAELETARAKEALLTTQLESAERTRAKLAAELEEAKGRIATLERTPGAQGTGAGMVAGNEERDRLAAELARIKTQRDELEQALAAAKGQAASPDGSAQTALLAERDRLLAENTSLATRSRELDEELAKVKNACARPAATDLMERLRTAEERRAALEAYLAQRAPTPPAPAPR
ncbi:hypothetical protein [Benzoatithermus flavus]|uniref:Chromosome partition protein Smc n=1 Tax=Benzoatithermus flavus TaxID=3108223 RepID=A0ABU8XN25_9PROT